jgi:hypothetical protein
VDQIVSLHSEPSEREARTSCERRVEKKIRYATQNPKADPGFWSISNRAQKGNGLFFKPILPQKRPFGGKSNTFLTFSWS